MVRPNARRSQSCVEHRLVRFGLGRDRPEAVHAAEIVAAVHRARAPPPGDFAFSTPIMAFRVTSVASSASLQPSVPAAAPAAPGNAPPRCESQTRTSTSSGSSSAELGEHAARVDDGARAVRRRTCTRPAAARAPARGSRSRACRRRGCALRRVLDHHHVLALAPREAQLEAIAGGGVAQQPFLVGRVAPGAGHHPGAVLRADPVLVGVDQLVERGRIDQPLLDQQRLERLNPERQLGRWLGVIMGVVLVGFAHDRTSRRAGAPQPRRSTLAPRVSRASIVTSRRPSFVGEA